MSLAAVALTVIGAVALGLAGGCGGTKKPVARDGAADGRADLGSSDAGSGTGGRGGSGGGSGGAVGSGGAGGMQAGGAGGGAAGAGGAGGAGGARDAGVAGAGGAGDAAAADARDVASIEGASSDTASSDAGTDSGTDAGTDVGTDAGSTDAAGLCNIPCINALVSQCPVQGTCVGQTAVSQATVVSNSCYATSVKTRATIGLTGIRREYFKANGAPCWSLEGSGLGGMITVKDGAGTVVATGTYNPTTMMGSITCGAQTYNLSTCDGAGLSPTAMTCQAGTCAVP